jgi:hypothetical protein
VPAVLQYYGCLTWCRILRKTTNCGHLRTRVSGGIFGHKREAVPIPVATQSKG